LSAFHFGSGYTSIGQRRYVFTRNRSKFPEPRAAIEKFRHQNVRVVVNLKPCLLDDHPAYAEVAARGAFVSDAKTHLPCIGQFWDGEGAHLDFTHPDGIRWWQESLRREVLDYGIDAGWNDNNEYEIWDDYGSSHGFGQPLPIDRSRPLQALLMTRATAEAQAAHRPGERVYTVTRAGPPGIQRYAQTWSGDNTTSWHTLRWNLRMGLTMSLSGMFNTGHDVGGFSGPVPDPELLVRWVQNGVFSPRFIMNSWKPGGEVNTPWLHPEALEPIRAAIRFRYRLMPYLYTLFRRAAVFGEPLLRPLFYEFEKDPRAFADCDDFMCGPELLVANVVEAGVRERSVYLPRGPEGWYDFDTGAYHQAGSEVTVAAPLSRIPMFARAGAIVPLTGRDDFSRVHDEPSRHLRVFPPHDTARATFALYEDDGISLRYRDGDYAEIVFDLQTTAAEIVLAARVSGRYALPYRQITVEFPPREKRCISLNGTGVGLAFST
jgi:alpha-glucosidase